MPYLSSRIKLVMTNVCILLTIISCSESPKNEERLPLVPNESMQHSREVLGFYTEPEEPFPGSEQTVAANFHAISSIAPFWYKLDDKRPGYLSCSVSAEHQKQVLQSAHAKGLHVYLLVHNLFYETTEKGKEVARAVLRDEKNRSQLIRSLRNEIKTFGYDGVNIDIENMHLDDGTAFSDMIKLLTDTLHRDGKLVTVSVPANSGDARANPWSPVFDYHALGKAADRLVIMTYDEHTPHTAPGPVASLDWTESTIRYALKQEVPHNKILLGISSYGWDWSTAERKAAYSSYDTVMHQYLKYRPQMLWDTPSQSPHFHYRDEYHRTHEVWFENNVSLQFKLDLVEKYGLQGIGIWRIGLEDPMYWVTITGKMKVKKMK